MLARAGYNELAIQLMFVMCTQYYLVPVHVVPRKILPVRFKCLWYQLVLGTVPRRISTHCVQT